MWRTCFNMSMTALNYTNPIFYFTEVSVKKAVKNLGGEIAVI